MIFTLSLHATTLAAIALVWAVSLCILALRLHFDAEFRYRLDDIAETMHSMIPVRSVAFWRRWLRVWEVVLAPYAALMAIRTLVRRAVKKLF